MITNGWKFTVRKYGEDAGQDTFTIKLLDIYNTLSTVVKEN